jgi:hypothetical protein
VAKFNVGGANTPFPKGTIAGRITSCANGQAISGAVVKTNTGFFAVTDANGFYAFPRMAPDTVNVTATKDGSGATTNGVVVTNGNTTTVNLCVAPVNLIIKASGAVVAGGSNGVLDPGETVTVALGVQNVGGPGACTSALTGTVQASGGVTNPSGPQNYGSVCAGSGPVYRNFTFTVSSGLPCGSTVTVSMALVDGATNYGTFSYTFVTGNMVTTLMENFDSVSAPGLPAGWTTSFSGSATGWTTSTLRADTAPNSAFGQETATVGLTELTSPVFTVNGGSVEGAKLSFRNQFNTEATYDGMVLEISIPGVNGGAFQDILAAGGSFVSGGYNSTINTDPANPLSGRMAWSGLSGGTAEIPGYITTVVNLPLAAAGHNVRLRWRLGSDSNAVPSTNPGVRIDTISVSTAVCGGNAPVLSAAVSRKTHGAAGTFDVPLLLPLPGGGSIGVEPRSGGASGAHTIVATFANPVSVGGVSVTMGTGSASYSVAGNVVTINLTGVTDIQRLGVTLANVSDGPNRGNLTIPMGVLLGDTNGSLSVTGSDVSQTKAAAASGSVSGSTFRSDVNVNGAINTSDIGLVKARSGASLP